GRFIEAGPSGSPMRGLVNVLPTGRNFYSVDPKSRVQRDHSTSRTNIPRNRSNSPRSRRTLH
ncbi:hypothetical protein BWZ31_12655, partial [Neisseria meningitidis]